MIRICVSILLILSGIGFFVLALTIPPINPWFIVIALTGLFFFGMGVEGIRLRKYDGTHQ